MKLKKIMLMFSGFVLLITEQISYSDPAVDRLLREARKRQAEEQKQQQKMEKIEEPSVMEEIPVTNTNSIQKRAAEIKRESQSKKAEEM
ncbi:hypothetical protein EII29_11515, partial [Leptotrichia sp. OH3620_COT-345]|uniref:hypothetical protein n=1 Tax=Leptotrichia sp. OH3620_COT-345 TaxID=2491048 RepID=UPI000FACEBEF